MDAEMLRTLKRPELTKLAKANGIKGNLKSSTIVQLLLERNPQGVPKSTPVKSTVRRTSRRAPSPPGTPSRLLTLIPVPTPGPLPSSIERPIQGLEIPEEDISSISRDFLLATHERHENYQQASSPPIGKGYSAGHHVTGGHGEQSKSQPSPYAVRSEKPDAVIPIGEATQPNTEVPKSIPTPPQTGSDVPPEPYSPGSTVYSLASTGYEDASKNCAADRPESVLPWRAEHAVKCLKEISRDHHVHRKSITDAVKNIRGLASPIEQIRTSLRQESANSERSAGWLAYSHKVRSYFNNRDLYMDEITVETRASGMLAEKYDREVFADANEAEDEGEMMRKLAELGRKNRKRPEVPQTESEEERRRKRAEEEKKYAVNFDPAAPAYRARPPEPLNGMKMPAFEFYGVRLSASPEHVPLKGYGQSRKRSRSPADDKLDNDELRRSKRQRWMAVSNFGRDDDRNPFLESASQAGVARRPTPANESDEGLSDDIDSQNVDAMLSANYGDGDTDTSGSEPSNENILAHLDDHERNAPRAQAQAQPVPEAQASQPMPRPRVFYKPGEVHPGF